MYKWRKVLCKKQTANPLAKVDALYPDSNYIGENV